jgi:glycerate-2-kinase
LIKNRQALLSNSSTEENRKLRGDVINILDSALEAVDPKRAVENSLKLEDGYIKLKPGNISYNLADVGEIYVVGGGKAGGAMSEAVENILGDRIEKGHVNVLKGTEGNYGLDRITLNGAAHPVPDLDGVKGVRRMLDTVEKASEEDIVIVLISGGGSALMPYPAEGISLNDLQETTSLLLMSGATINELNSVRKHLSGFKGGKLAENCFPSTVISLILSDVVGDPIDTIASGPTAPDNSFFRDAYSVMINRKVWEPAPEKVKNRILMGLDGGVSETPKPGDEIFGKVSNNVIANNAIAAEAACKAADILGYDSFVLSTFVEGEAKEVGTVFAGIVREVEFKNRPVKKPGAVIIGGESTVRVTGDGVGGRNMELALSASLKISSAALIACLATDGIDGPTDSAGAIVDGYTLSRAEKKGLDVGVFLENNDSYSFFRALDDFIFTGPTGTNVNDLAVIMVGDLYQG